MVDCERDNFNLNFFISYLTIYHVIISSHNLPSHRLGIISPSSLSLMREIERNSRQQPTSSHNLPSHLPSHHQPSHNLPSHSPSHEENKTTRDDLVFTNLFSLNKDVTKINQIGEREMR